MRKAAWGFFLVLVPLLAGRAEGRETGPEKPGKPLNVILMIGDGMGLSQLSTVYYYSDREPSFSRFTHIGLQRTSSATEAVTQSSAAATAMSTGVKTYNTAVGVGVDSLPLTNLVEKISPEGYLTGLVVTSSVTDATPAGFYAHQPDRYMFEDIAKDLLCSEIDFFAGAGFKYFRDSTVKDPLLPMASMSGSVNWTGSRIPVPEALRLLAGSGKNACRVAGTKGIPE
ncbi:MAG: alkaline phosphatase [Bacteroidales bacterium]